MSSDTAMARCVAIKPKIQRIEKDYFETDDPPVFALRDELLKLYRENALLKIMVFDVRNVGINENNRYGDGVEPSHCHNLVDLLLAGGTSKEEMGIPLATQMPPKGHRMHDSAWNFLRKIIEDSAGTLPAYTESSEVWINTCSKTHTMQAIRVCALEHVHVPGPGHESILSRFMIGGKVDLGLVNKFRPELADIVKNGVSFEVLLWPVEEMFPRTIEILQEVGNLGQQAAQGETRWEVCLNMHNSAITLARTDDANTHVSVDEIWARVTRNAKRGNPVFKNEIDDLGVFTREFAGAEAESIKQIISFHKSIQSPKVIKGDVFKAIAVATLGADGQGCNEFRMDFANESTILIYISMNLNI